MIGPWIIVVLPLLLAATISDCRHRLIPDWVSLGLVASFVAYVLLHPGATAWPGAIMAAALLFALACVAFRFGWLGGGDVKLLGACGLWAGWEGLIDFLFLTTLFGGLIALGLLLARWFGRLRAPGMPPAGQLPTVPYGVAISAAILWTTLTTHAGVR